MIARRLFPLWAVLGFMVWCGQSAIAAEPEPAAVSPESVYRRLKVGIGYHYSTGDYGGSETTAISYVPLVITGEIGRWMLQATIPYLYISGPGGISEGPNGPIQTKSGHNGGFGDVLIRGSYLVPIRSLLPEQYAANPWFPFVDVIGLVKFPTASSSKGLGTGKFDYGIEGELSWGFGKISPFLAAGCRFLGSPSDPHVDSVFVGSIGGVYQLLETLSAGLLLDYREAPAVFIGQQLEIVPFASWKFLPPWSVETYVSAGLASGSPAAGVGLQLVYTW